MSNAARPAPRLAAPGDGLPALEARMAGIALRLLARFYPTERTVAMFCGEAAAALESARGLSEEQGRTRVLIKRLAGIEDSSRHWSVYMTVAHLVIVGRAIRDGVPRLAAGEALAHEVRVEDVKPSPDAGPECLADLAQLCSELRAMLPRLADPRGGSRLVHPWFGPLCAAEWLALAAVHNGIHRRQIQRIIAGLPHA